MELRSFSHLHFIQVIKRGTVEKILNRDCHGRPTFRFKTIKAIYESENAKNLGSCTTLQQQGGGLMGLPLGCGGIKVDSPVLLMDGRKIKSDPELCDLYEDVCDNKRNGNMGDFSFSEMTLKQLKESCKKKKRKLPKFVDVKKEPCSHLNEDYTKLQQKEDESDLEETLSNWKLKLWNKPKAKRKRIRKDVHSLSKFAVSVSEPTPRVPQDSSQSTGGLNGPIKTEIEISELGFSDCHDLDGLTFGATPNTHFTVDASANVSDEVAGISNRSELAIGESTSLTTESPNCVVAEVLIEHLEHDNSLSHPASAVVGEVMEDSFSEVVSQDNLSSSVSEFDANVRFIQSTPSASPIEALCITNKPAHEKFSCESYSFMQWTSCEIDSSSVIHMPHKLNGENIYDGGYMFSMESEGGSKEDTLPDPEKDVIRKSDILYLSFQNSHPCSDFSSVDCTSPTIEEQNHSSLSTEGLVSASVDMESEGDIKEDNPPNPKTSVTNNPDISSQNFHTCLNLPNNLKDFNSATDVKHSFPTKEGPVSNIARVRDCFVGTNPSDDTESCTANEVLKNFNALKLESPPKRLFVARKVISPTSQEKLRQTVDADYSNDDIGLSKYRERPRFGEQSKIGAYSTRSDLEGVEVKVNLQRIILKPKNEKSKPNLLVPKGILKSPNVSCAIPHAATESTYVHPHAESAIAFSQRQMHDIECLATKLVKELKFIKDIVEDKLHSEVYTTTSSKYTVDETIVAVQKAGEVEENTRKWLSMMAKDCSRFCKIMRSSGKKAPAAPKSGYGLHKDRKKIIFADEAGGPLCHVKVFEDQLASLSGSECENEKRQATRTERNACCTLEC
ncbi:uncharacterized protein LOC122657355 [Telopea speciosissima]|uniref:uncharacterized protein LOC122657355 n=1 Tax=Telopea speciosissima TaxID=54955 RepID=UPI001CC7DC75|nr:uncharacterized protein LOC122657355 [Telopea speciosissima]